MRPLRLSRFLLAVAFPAVAFPVIAALQIRLGYEFALFPLYMFPVAALSWEFGWRGGLAAVAAACGCWLVGSHWSGQPYSSELLRYHNAAIRGSVFAATSCFVLVFRRVVEQHMRRMESMRALLKVCHGCGAVQGGDGEWVPFEELLKPRPKPVCECPRCTAVHARRAPAGGKREV